MPTHRGPVHQFKRFALDLKERYAQPFAFVHINKTGGTSVVRALGIRFQHLTAGVRGPSAPNLPARVDTSSSNARGGAWLSGGAFSEKGQL